MNRLTDVTTLPFIYNLHSNDHLTTLNLQKNELTNATSTALIKILDYNFRLTDVNLDLNEISWMQID